MCFFQCSFLNTLQKMESHICLLPWKKFLRNIIEKCCLNKFLFLASINTFQKYNKIYNPDLDLSFAYKPTGKLRRKRKLNHKYELILSLPLISFIYYQMNNHAENNFKKLFLKIWTKILTKRDLETKRKFSEFYQFEFFYLIRKITENAQNIDESLIIFQSLNQLMNYFSNLENSISLQNFTKRKCSHF